MDHLMVGERGDEIDFAVGKRNRFAATQGKGAATTPRTRQRCTISAAMAPKASASIRELVHMYTMDVLAPSRSMSARIPRAATAIPAVTANSRDANARTTKGQTR